MKCELTNEQLIEKAHQWIKSLAETGGKSWTLKVPVDFNNDPDMIFSELCNRLQSTPPSPMEEALKDSMFMNGGNTDEEKRFYAMGFKAALTPPPNH